MSQYPVGNIVECLFCFTTRPLTPTELQTFLAGGGLPAGVGVDQTAVKFNYSINNAPVVVVTGGAVVHDAAGAYHSNITITEAGDYRYWGASFDGGGNPVAATVTNHFTGTPN